MENITIGQIFDTIIRLSVVIGAVGVLLKLTNKGTGKMLDEKLKPLNNNIKKIDNKVDKETLERLKSDLTTFIYLAEHDTLSDGQRIRMYEEYDDYIKMGGNSYIKESFNKLKKEGKI